jgi:hypothetical protein
LLVQSTAETALFTNVATMGNDQSRAEASVTCWIEIDGEPVVVSSDYMDTGLDKQEASEVVFDKRAPGRRRRTSTTRTRRSGSSSTPGARTASTGSHSTWATRSTTSP